MLGTDRGTPAATCRMRSCRIPSTPS